ncbi:hypothetical protein GXM_05107 [Nostoc sphaeroides CCNUC1]|uniref:Uncharacterized protein n=1 Tax=Nostoc sphaeroides CCNUC1 TaxID=2653204 RepID=A0A5P8W4E7_9NOSO|nr:hypothetical protein GXM_05107 [Nostoc sphaeroides CCNUC1]
MAKLFALGKISVHLSGLQLSAQNLSSGRDVVQCDILTVTKKNY